MHRRQKQLETAAVHHPSLSFYHLHPTICSILFFGIALRAKGLTCCCRKLGLHCAAVCGNWYGQFSLTISPNINDVVYCDSAEDIDPSCFKHESMAIKETANEEGEEEESLTMNINQ